MTYWKDHGNGETPGAQALKVIFYNRTLALEIDGELGLLVSSTSEFENSSLTISCGKQSEDLLNGTVGLVVGGFDFADGLERFVGLVMEQGVCQWPADALMKEDEHERGFGPLIGEAVTVAASDTFQQSMSFHLAHVVAKLGEGVGGGE